MSNQDGFSDDDDEVEAMLGSSRAIEPTGVPGSDKKFRPYDADIVSEMQANGLPKPDDCSWYDWNVSLTNDKTHRHDLLIMYAAHGKRINEIAAELDFHPTYVGQLLKTKDIQIAVKKRQEKLFENKHRKRIEAMINPALDVLDSLLHNDQEKSNIRADIAKYLIDQGAGKAKQEIHHEHSMLNEFYEKLESKSREIKDITMKLAKPKDSLDTFVEEFIPDSFTVGDKNAKESEPGQGLSEGAEPSSQEDGFGETDDWV